MSPVADLSRTRATTIRRWLTERDFLFDPRLLIASAAAGNGQAARFDFVVDLA